MLPPAESVSFAARSTDLQLVNGGGVIVGWSFQESTNAAAATLELYDGTGTGGNLLSPITLVTNESTRDLIGGDGLQFRNGVFFHAVSGSVKGAVWVVTAARYDEARLLAGWGNWWA